jgi:DNA-binding protein YbaB
LTGGLADSLIARIEKQRDLIQAMDQHCKSISVRATSRCKSVSVEVDGLGAMTGLWLGDNAYHNGSEALGRLIVDTAQVAAQAVVRRQRYLIQEFADRMRALQQAPLVRHDGTTLQPGSSLEATAEAAWRGRD